MFFSSKFSFKIYLLIQLVFCLSIILIWIFCVCLIVKLKGNVNFHAASINKSRSSKIYVSELTWLVLNYVIMIAWILLRDSARHTAWQSCIIMNLKKDLITNVYLSINHIGTFLARICLEGNQFVSTTTKRSNEFLSKYIRS